MLGYIAAALTLILGVLGIFFSKSGELNKISRIGVGILTLTVASGVLALYDVYLKSSASFTQQETIARLRADAARLNNLSVASVLGIDRKFRRTIFWVSLAEDSKEESRSSVGDHSASFVDVLVSKTDLAQRIQIDFQWLDSTINIRLLPKDGEGYHVEQHVDGKHRNYVCSVMCGASREKQSHELANRQIIVGDYVAGSLNIGLDVSGNESVGKTISDLQRMVVPLGSIEITFGSSDEYLKFRRVAQKLQFSIKFHGSRRAVPDASCSLAVFAPVSAVMTHDARALKTKIDLGTIGSLDMDLCETPP